MNILVTGESGFIATNLVKSFNRLGHKVIAIEDSNVKRLSQTGEVCVYRNESQVWEWHLRNLDIDIVIHNAAVVGTDVVALNPDKATLTNIVGTYNILQACNALKVPVCYMGTTVIYDTSKYQSKRIKEDSSLNPTTFYGIQKLAAERLIRTHSNDWLVMRPLFAYGGVGDMNSLIAKTVYALKNKRDKIDMFLNPEKIKDYLHVEDYCDAVAVGCDHGLWGKDFNVAAETPLQVEKIINIMSDLLDEDLSRVIKWHPETDYLGNHMLSSQKFKNASGWQPKISLVEGIKNTIADIMSDESAYNPLMHLDEAKSKNIQLTDFFNSNI